MMLCSGSMVAAWCRLSIAVSCFAAGAAAAKDAGRSNPLSKVVELLGNLQTKVTANGEKEDQAYHAYFEWCDDTSHNVKNEITSAKADKADLEARIDKLSGEIQAASSNIEKLAAAVSKADKELAGAKKIREQEKADFEANDKELMQAIDTLERASSILEKEMGKKASFAQIDTQSMRNTLAAVSLVLDAAGFSGEDQQKLASLIQSQTASSEDDEDLDSLVGAPKAASYESKSGGVVDLIEDMKEKAEGQLQDIRKAETESAHNYDMLKQSVKDQLGADSGELEKQKARKASATEQKATAEGELQVTTKKLDESTKKLAATQSGCMQVAADHEATIEARKTELEALAKAKTVLRESTGGAEEQTYSFAQVSAKAKTTRGRSAALLAVKRLAKAQHSSALAQLAARMGFALRQAAENGEDPFSKVKGLIKDMVAKLESQADAEATEKAYCDEQLVKTGEKKDDLEADISKMTATVDTSVSRLAKLQEQIQELQQELGALAKEQAELDKLRMTTHAEFVEIKADLEEGISGVRKALGILRDYYATKSPEGASLVQEDDDASFGSFMQQPAKPQKHEQSSGAGGSIIGILEVIESDFATNLAKKETEEADAQSDYDKMSQENKVDKGTKEQDLKYKVQETKSLEKTIAEFTSDRDTTQSELDAVNQYLAKVKDRCVAKPEAYEVRKERRAREIAGLKEALQILKGEAAMLQQGRAGRRQRQARSLRGGDSA